MLIICPELIWHFEPVFLNFENDKFKVTSLVLGLAMYESDKFELVTSERQGHIAKSPSFQIDYDVKTFQKDI